MYEKTDTCMSVCFPKKNAFLSFKRIKLVSDKADYKLAPNIRGVYLFCSNFCFGMENATPYPLYVGQSINIQGRLKGHPVSVFLRRWDKASIGRPNRTIDFWYAETDCLDFYENLLTNCFAPAFDGIGSGHGFWTWMDKEVVMALRVQGFKGIPRVFDQSNGGRFLDVEKEVFDRPWKRRKLRQQPFHRQSLLRGKNNGAN